MNNETTEDTPQKHKRSILLMIVLGVFAFSFYKLLLVDRMGFCYKRLWFTSSRELILHTIDALMKSKSGVMKLDVADISPEAYLARHPNCCRVDWGNDGAFTRGLMYFGSATVSVTYELSDEGREHYGADDIENYYQLIVDYTACGEPLRNTGTSTTAPIAR